MFDEHNRDKVKTTIKENYQLKDNTLSLIEKVVVEDKDKDYSGQERIKYDIVKWLLDTTDSIYASGEIENIGDIELETLSQKIALNTLYQYGFIN